MNGHLSEDAMLRWQMGNASEAETVHVAGCRACQGQTQSLTDTLGWFGAAARQWGEEQGSTTHRWLAASPAPRRHRWHSVTAGVAMVCAILLVMLGIAMPRWQAHRATFAAQAREKQMQQELARDNALMEAVDRDVSQEVPDAMEPLSWEKSWGNTDGARSPSGSISTRQ